MEHFEKPFGVMSEDELRAAYNEVMRNISMSDAVRIESDEDLSDDCVLGFRQKIFRMLQHARAPAHA